MAVRYGRWIAALIVLALLLAVVVLFGTVDLDSGENTLTDVRSAPILATDGPTGATVTPLPSQDERPPGEQSPFAPQDRSP